ncbi:hypothetical protein TNCV_4299011 [Trichonephila clavipes]|nr:hypothetical protein TNCV_4299011 [Trichonephila clavipes]
MQNIRNKIIFYPGSNGTNEHLLRLCWKSNVSAAPRVFLFGSPPQRGFQGLGQGPLGKSTVSQERRGLPHCTGQCTLFSFSQLLPKHEGSVSEEYSILFVCATKVRLSKQQDEDHERYAAQRYPTHVQSVTYPANTQAKEEAVPAANQDRI